MPPRPRATRTTPTHQRASDAELVACLERQDAATLVALLMELAARHPPVRDRLERMRRTSTPAAELRAVLTGWRRTRRFLDWRDAPRFAEELHDWIDEVTADVAPDDPDAALALLEAFIESDARFFERADDSGGHIGDAVGTACRAWLAVAPRSTLSERERAERMRRLYDGSDYGAREGLLRDAALALGEEAMRVLAGDYETRLRSLVALDPTRRTQHVDVFAHSAALGLLADALGDPELTVRATCIHSPAPNPLQRARFVRAYLAADRAADAMPWLEGTWERWEHEREALLAEAFERLGRPAESAPLRRAQFARSLSPDDLERWLGIVPASARDAILDDVRTIAANHADVAAGAAVYLHLGDVATADAHLVAGAVRVRGSDYEVLRPLAKTLRSHGAVRGETLLLRALVDDILGHARSKAYVHAARDWRRLEEIAGEGASLAPLPPHAAYAEGVRARHGRKRSFWVLLEGRGGMTT